MNEPAQMVGGGLWVRCPSATGKTDEALAMRVYPTREAAEAGEGGMPLADVNLSRLRARAPQAGKAPPKRTGMAEPSVVRFSQLNRAQRRAQERVWAQRRRRALRRQRREAKLIAREAAAVREKYYAEVSKARAQAAASRRTATSR